MKMKKIDCAKLVFKLWHTPIIVDPVNTDAILHPPQIEFRFPRKGRRTTSVAMTSPENLANNFTLKELQEMAKELPNRLQKIAKQVNGTIENEIG